MEIGSSLNINVAYHCFISSNFHHKSSLLKWQNLVREVCWDHQSSNLGELASSGVLLINRSNTKAAATWNSAKLRADDTIDRDCSGAYT